ncbi:DUF4169 family protein [Sphingomonas sp.]|uniref:DUF4169 family protein n=1 Tax=Sphingomonas sp. TaxID=28214 RepID=UPI002DD68F68|nr:DUF4169 family protein [Sphingomonas sp.]
MAEIVNLNRVRKAKAKAARAGEAQANRAKFGRTKGEKQRTALEDAQRVALLDGAKRMDD